MKRIAWLSLKMVCVCIITVNLTTMQVEASETTDSATETVSSDLLDKLELDDIQKYIDENEDIEDISFYDLVTGLIAGKEKFDYQKIMTYISNLFFAEFRENKGQLIIIILLAVSFAVLKNFISIFENSYISELCFVLVYIELMVLLMKSFLAISELLNGTLNNIVEFMKMLIPVYCMSLVFSTGVSTAAGIYEMTFGIIFIIQWVMLYFLSPMVQVFIVLEFLNYMIEGEKFTRMTELLEGGIKWCLKIIVSVVAGLNVVQGLINPAIDKVKLLTVQKTVSMIPGIGNVTDALGDIMVGTGVLIKNSVGVAAIILLVVICAVPVIKIFVIAVLYKATAAAIEPVTDKRIAGCINGVFKGSVLIGKIMLTSLFLFFLTIAMITASSGYMAS